MSLEVPQSPQLVPNGSLTVNPEPKKKNSLPLVLLSLLVLVLVGSGGFILAKYLYSPKPASDIVSQQNNQLLTNQRPVRFNPNSEKVATVPATVDEAVNWATYSLPEFSIRLPNGWFGNQINDGKDSWFENYDVKHAQGRDFSQDLDKGKLKIEISLENYTGDLTSFVSERHKEEETRGPRTFNDSVIIVNKLKMVKSESGNGITAIYAKHPTKQEVLTILFGLDFDNYKQLLNQILSTFKFL